MNINIFLQVTVALVPALRVDNDWHWGSWEYHFRKVLQLSRACKVGLSWQNTKVATPHFESRGHASVGRVFEMTTCCRVEATAVDRLLRLRLWRSCVYTIVSEDAESDKETKSYKVTVGCWEPAYARLTNGEKPQVKADVG